MNPKENEYKNCYRADQKVIPKLHDTVAGFQITKCLHVVAKLNVSLVIGTTLESKKSISEIAKEVGSDCYGLLILMRALVANGIYVEKEQGVFGHNDVSLAMSDPYIRDEIVMYGDPCFYGYWDNLIETVVSGKSQVNKNFHANSYYDFLIKNPDQELIFSKGMTSLSKRTTPYLAKLGDYDKFDTICDLGGSHGILLSEILKICPNVKKVINFDQPSLLEKLKASTERPWTEDPRYSEVAGDFFESVPPADCYTMKCIIHNWEDSKSKVLLNIIAKSIKPGGKVHILEYILDDGMSENQNYTRIMDLQMLHLCNASERTKKQFEEMVKDTPFKIEKFILTEILHSQHTIVLALK